MIFVSLGRENRKRLGSEESEKFRRETRTFSYTKNRKLQEGNSHTLGKNASIDVSTSLWSISTNSHHQKVL